MAKMITLLILVLGVILLTASASETIFKDEYYYIPLEEGLPTTHEIIGDTIRINVSGKGMLSQTPYLLKDVTNQPVVNFTSFFNTTQCLDVAFGFDIDTARPTGVEVWTKNVSHPYTEYYGVTTETSSTCNGKKNVNYGSNATTFWCNDQVCIDSGREFPPCHWEVKDYNRITGATVYFNTTDAKPRIAYNYYDDWKNINDKFGKISALNKTWYYATDININPNQTISIRPTIQIDPKLGKNSGKYDIIMKRCSDTIQQAWDSGNHVYIDPWWNSSFSNCREINITNPQGTALVDFPFLVALNGTRDFGSALATGADLRFVNGSNCNGAGVLLNSEIEYFNNTNNATLSYVWLKHNFAANEKLTISVYYNNSAATTQGNAPNQVWTNNFYNVYHLLNVSDSNAITHGANQGATFLQTNCKIGLCADFEKGESDKFNISPTAWNMNFGNAFSLSNWIKMESTDTANMNFISISSNVNYQYAEIYEQNTDKKFYGEDYENSGSNNKIGTTTTYSGDTNWHFIAINVSATSAITLFVDGVNVGSAVANNNDLSTANDYAYLGAFVYDSPTAYGGYFDGLMDEVRIENVSRPLTWFNASYLNQNTPLTYIVVGAQQSAPAAGDTTPPAITWNYPTGNITITASNQTYFNISGNEALSNCTLQLNVTKYNMTSQNTTVFNYTVKLANGIYNFSASCQDTTGNTNTSLSYSLNMSWDSTVPAITWLYPTGNLTIITTNLTYFNISGSEALGNCTLNLNSTLYNMTSMSTTNFNYSIKLANGVYGFNASCQDTTGNMNITPSYALNMSYYLVIVSNLQMKSINLLNDTYVNWTSSWVVSGGQNTLRSTWWYNHDTTKAVLILNFNVNDTYARDLSGNNNDGTINNGLWVNNGGKDGSGSFNFTNNNTYINFTRLFNVSNDFTIIIDFIRNNDNDTTLFAVSNATDGDYDFRIRSTNTNGDLQFEIRNTTNSTYTSPLWISTNNTYHQLAIVHSGDSYTPYIDTVNTYSYQVFNPRARNYVMFLGALYSLSNFSTVTIDKVRIYNRVLTSVEIGDLYNNNTGFSSAESSTNGNYTLNVVADDGLTYSNKANYSFYVSPILPIVESYFINKSVWNTTAVNITVFVNPWTFEGSGNLKYSLDNGVNISMTRWNNDWKSVNNNQTSRNDFTYSPTTNNSLLFSYEHQGSSDIYGGVAVYNGYIWFGTKGTNAKNLTKMNASTGNPICSRVLDNPIDSVPMVDSVNTSIIWVTTYGTAGGLYGINVNDCSMERNKTFYQGSANSPNQDDGYIYLVNYNGNELLKINKTSLATTGNFTNPAGNSYAAGFTPLIVGDKITYAYYSTDTKALLYIVNKTTMTQLANITIYAGDYQDTQGLYFDDSLVIGGVSNNVIYRFNFTTYTIMWNYTMPDNGDQVMFTPLLSNDNNIWFNVESKGLQKINSTNGAVICNESGATGITHSYASPILANGIVYAAHATYIVAVNDTNCNTIWRYNTTSLFFGQPAISDGVLYIMNDNTTYAFGKYLLTYFANFTAMNGTHTLDIHAIDRLGNINTTRYTFDVEIDVIPPVLIFVNTTPSNGTTLTADNFYVNISSDRALNKTWIEFYNITPLWFNMTSTSTGGKPYQLQYKLWYMYYDGGWVYASDYEHCWFGRSNVTFNQVLLCSVEVYMKDIYAIRYPTIVLNATLNNSIFVLHNTSGRVSNTRIQNNYSSISILSGAEATYKYGNQTPEYVNTTLIGLDNSSVTANFTTMLQNATSRNLSSWVYFMTLNTNYYDDFLGDEWVDTDEMLFDENAVKISLYYYGWHNITALSNNVTNWQKQLTNLSYANVSYDYRVCGLATNNITGCTEYRTVFLYINTTPTSSCTCTDGVQWNVNLSENCLLSSDCNTLPYPVSMFGTGDLLINATLITNFTSIETLPATSSIGIYTSENGKLYLQP